MYNKNLKLFLNCSNLFGAWSDEIKTRIVNFLNNPTFETWTNIHTIIINSKMNTIWQAIIEYDSTFQKSAEYTDDSYTQIKWANPFLRWQRPWEICL